MSLKFLQELGIEKETDINDLKGLEINFSAPNCLEIVTLHLPTVEAIGKLLYLIYNKLNYLFDYLDYRVVVRGETTTVDKNTIQKYFSFIITTPFLWKDKRDLVFFCEQEELLGNFDFRRNTVYLHFPTQQDLNNWKPKLAALKEILVKLGLTKLRFGKKEKSTTKNNDNSPEKISPINNEKHRAITERRKNNFSLASSPPPNNKKNTNKSALLQEWKGRKLIELGVHTKFSTLDGISSPADYATNARQKKLCSSGGNRPL